MSPEQREAIVAAVGIFPHGVCCGICSHNQLGMGYSNNMPGNMPPGYSNNMGQEASIPPSGQGQHNPWLSQIGGPTGGATEELFRKGSHDSSEVTEANVWGTSPWLQQPLQRQDMDSTIKAMQNLTVSKELLNVQVEKSHQELDADNLDEDVDSEIYERAVRFIEELSTEESGDEDQPLSGDKEDSIQPTLTIRESGSNNGACPPMWNPQEAWVADVNGPDRWKLDPGLNYWTMRSIDRIA